MPKMMADRVDEAQEPSPPSALWPSRKFDSQRFHSTGVRPLEEAALQVEYPSCSWQGAQSAHGSCLHPIDAKLLREFWTIKEAPVTSAAAVAHDGQFCSAMEACFWGPSRLSRSVSLQEFKTNARDRCMRAGTSGTRKGDGRVRLGRQSATDCSFTCGPAPAPPAAVGRALNSPSNLQIPRSQSLNQAHASMPAFICTSAGGGFAADAGLAGTCTSAGAGGNLGGRGLIFRSLTLPPSRTCDGDAVECKQHGGRHEAMDRRVRGGRLLRRQSKEQHCVSVLSLLDAVVAGSGPQNTRSEADASCDITAAATVCPPAAAAASVATAATASSRHSSPFSAASPPLGGLNLSRLYSLDSATLHNLDRALSSMSDNTLSAAIGGVAGGGVGVKPPLHFTAAISSSAPQPCELLAGSDGVSRIYKVRPLGAAGASSLSLHNAGGGGGGCPLGSPFSRCNSTLLDFAEGQASLAAAVQQSLGAGVAAAADYLTILTSANNSLSGAAGANMHGSSYPSSAAGSLSVSPNSHQPHVSLGAPLGAVAATSRGGRLSSDGGGSAAAAVAAATSGYSLPLPLHSSLPTEMGRLSASGLGGAPDMRFFPFSSPEDFCMAATVLLEAKLPLALLEDEAAAAAAAAASPLPADGAAPRCGE